MESNSKGCQQSSRVVRKFTPLYNELAEAHNSITSKTSRVASKKSVPMDPEQDAQAFEMKAANRRETLSKLTGDEDHTFPTSSITPSGNYGSFRHSLSHLFGMESSPQDRTSCFTNEWPTIEDFENCQLDRQQQHVDSYGISSQGRIPPLVSESGNAAPHIPSGYKTYMNPKPSPALPESELQEQSFLYETSENQKVLHLQARSAYSNEPQISPPYSFTANSTFKYLQGENQDFLRGQYNMSDHGPNLTRKASWADLDQGPGPDIGSKAPIPRQRLATTGFSSTGLDIVGGLGQRNTSSLGEGSTVENIVKQYGTDEFHDVDLHSEYEDDTDDEPFGLKAPSSDIVLHVRMNQSPRQPVHVPAMPCTRNTDWPPPPMREPPPVPLPGSKEFGYVSRQSSNPFHPKAIEARKKAELAREAAAKDVKKSNTKKALERDVSQALRHLGDSEMTIQEVLRSDRASGHPSSRASIGVLNSDGYSRDGAKSKLGFYKSHAIPSMWNNVDKVRVPIERGECREHRNINRNADQYTSQEGLADDAADDEDGWETVLGSQMASRMPSSAGGREMRFQKTGSSVADNSSHGDISPISIRYDHFSSTDKIVAHPAGIDGVHSFRTRNNSFGAAPVLMPTYRDHNTNGFLQNSSRFPPSPHQSPSSTPYEQPLPMPPHENPFLSSPPSDFSPSTPKGVKRWKGKDVDRNIHNGYGLAHSEPFQEPVKPKAAYKRPYIGDGDEDGEDDGGDDSYEDKNGVVWVRMSVNGGLSKRVRRDRTPLVRQPMSFQMPPKKEKSSMVLLSLPIKQHPKQMNWAESFYQRFRSKVGYGRRPNSQFKTLHRQESKNLKRRSQTRPQCLRHDPVPEPPFNSDGTPPKGFTKQDAFEFRSPLAPVKRESWQALYTKDQLATFRERARSGGVDDLEARWGQPGSWSNRRGTFSGRAMKTVNYAPNLFRFNHRPDEDIENSEGTISAFCLALCCIFPPILFFYYTGYFDFVMAWRTRGQTLEMQKHHKKMAFWLAPTLTFGICVAIVAIVLGVHFSNKS